MKPQPPKHYFELQNPREALRTCGPELGHFDHLRAMGDWTKGGTTGHHIATRAGLGGAPPPDDHAGEISRRAATGLSRIEPAKRRRKPPWVTGVFPLFSHFRPAHSSIPPFLDPLNSFPWSFFADSSLFESYDENKVG